MNTDNENRSGANFHVITGGPGVGKTTLVGALAKRGFITVDEDARKIIKAQRYHNGKGLPWEDKTLYARLMLEASLHSYHAAQSNGTSEPIFFDRGLVDTVCYMAMEDMPLTTDIDTIVSDHRYSRKVFILPSWREIYTTDSERKQTWLQAKDTFSAMKSTYERYGYETIEVPQLSPEDRAAFLLEHI